MFRSGAVWFSIAVVILFAAVAAYVIAKDQGLI